MVTQFGWSDTLYALSNCLACSTVSSSSDSLHNYAQHAHGPRRSSASSRNREGTSRSQLGTQPLSDGLRPLLLEESTDDEYTDTLSLHSNVGGRREDHRGSRRYSNAGSVVSLVSSPSTDRDTSALVRAKLPNSKSKGKGNGKEMGRKRRQNDGFFTVLGYDLFGKWKPKPAIQLPLTDDEEEEEDRTEEGNSAQIRTQSGGTLDSDAAPLDDEAIAALGRAHIAGQGQHRDAHIGQEEELSQILNDVKRAEKDGRRRGRRERKERKALGGALLMSGMSDSHQEFEGFQGSGDGVTLAGFKSPPASGSLGGTGTSPALGGAGDGDEEETLVDLDGSLYVRTVQHSVHGTNAIGFGPQTALSTTTGSGSNSSVPHHRSRSDQFHDDMFSPANAPRKKKSKAKRNKPTLSSSSVSTSTGTISPSLPSPTRSTSLGVGLSHSISLTQSGSQAQLHFPQRPSSMTNFVDGKSVSTDISKREGLLYFDDAPSVTVDPRGFPSVGFGVTGRRRGDSQSNGAFLARRGDS